MTQSNPNVNVSIEAPILFFGEFRFRVDAPLEGQESSASRGRAHQGGRPPYALPTGTARIPGPIRVSSAAGWPVL